MAIWNFRRQRAADVRQELTQRDQFNNDDVALADALVREVIQNSSDAGIGSQTVKVRFNIKNLDKVETEQLRQVFLGLIPHFSANDMDQSALEEDYARVLVVEDFGTSGLTGRYDILDEANENDHFRHFWRVHGGSGKTGGSGGRWGLGKLVYSSSSKLHTFFGLTLRDGDDGPLLMGQAVLNSHLIDGQRFMPHGFWFDKWSEGEDPLQLPVTDEMEIEIFSNLVGVGRKNQTGLSVIVPYIKDDIDEDAIISGVVRNYYFSILSGHLVVEVGDCIIDQTTFRSIADSTNQSASERIPFEFVEAVSSLVTNSPDVEALTSLSPRGLDARHFDAGQLSAVREKFAEGGIVHARIPLELKSKSGEHLPGHIDLFLKSLSEDERPFALVTRGKITLPGEQKFFRSSPAFGALVANNENVVAFLGDAENPAHTAWNTNAEKLTDRWRNPGATLSSIRHSLRLFHDLLSAQQDTKDDDALIDFFSLVDQGQAKKRKKKGVPKPEINVPKRERAIVIRKHKGGFQIVPGPAVADWTLPQDLRVRVAYDMIGANPFKRHSLHDFDLTKGDIALDADGAKVLPANKHTLAIRVTDKNFKISASGFDEKRDIVVDARVSK